MKKKKENKKIKVIIIVSILVIILLSYTIILSIWYKNDCNRRTMTGVAIIKDKTYKLCSSIDIFIPGILKGENGTGGMDKPIIYLYPEKEEEISVKLEIPENISVSYPKYKDEWKVLAKPNGDLIDLKTNKKLYSLYYETKETNDIKVEEDGFIVKGIDTINFLEEKLSILGLNYKEREEFIVYWLPQLEKNKYNYIRFATPEEIEKNMPLNFSKEPDTLIRILMTYKKLDNPIKVKEQKLSSPKREGFTAVEWGGTEIK